MLAAKAYDLHNAELQGTGLMINTPETMWNVPLAEVGPLWRACLLVLCLQLWDQSTLACWSLVFVWVFW